MLPSSITSSSHQQHTHHFTWGSHIPSIIIISSSKHIFLHTNTLASGSSFLQSNPPNFAHTFQGFHFSPKAIPAKHFIPQQFFAQFKDTRIFPTTSPSILWGLISFRPFSNIFCPKTIGANPLNFKGISTLPFSQFSFAFNVCGAFLHFRRSVFLGPHPLFVSQVQVPPNFTHQDPLCCQGNTLCCQFPLRWGPIPARPCVCAFFTFPFIYISRALRVSFPCTGACLVLYMTSHGFALGGLPLGPHRSSPVLLRAAPHAYTPIRDLGNLVAALAFKRTRPLLTACGGRLPCLR